MSTPAPVTENTPLEKVALPAMAGVPTSCHCHGAGRPLAAATVKVTELLSVPPAVTMAGPVVAPDGTVVTILASPHAVGVAATPLNRMAPGAAPKRTPVIVTSAPTGPLVGDNPVIEGP